MPIYVFHCDSCNATEDRFMSMAEMEANRNNQRCQRCESPMRRVFTPFAILGSDTRFFQGTDDGFGGDQKSRNIALARARAAGVSTSGKKYFGQVCRRGQPFDPEAWCGDTSEIKRKLAAQGKGAEGSINLKARAIEEPEKPYRVAEDIVNRETRLVARERGLKNLTPREKRQLKEEVRQRISPAKRVCE